MLLKKTQLILCNTKLRIGRKSVSGINNQGKKTLFHKGGASARLYRVIDFSKYISNIPGMIISFEYDPNRSSPISLVVYSNGALAYNLSVSGTLPGSIILTSGEARYRLDSINYNFGDTNLLNLMRPGMYINCISVNKNKAQLARTAGCFAKLVSLAKTQYVIIKLKSKTLLRLDVNNWATVGSLSVPFRTKIKNAGSNRRLGVRPTVRGVAMNPIDHPHGGGQGKTSGGRPSVSPWARTAKGGRTRKKLNYAKTKLKR